MPKASRESASENIAVAGYEAAIEHFEGGYTVCFERHTAAADPGPLFQGLPDDRCQCPHWGVVLAGEVTFRYADRDETYSAGDAYYAPPGHLPLLQEGTEVVEFSPSDALGETMAVVQSNLAADGG